MQITKSQINACLIVIGNEILSGRTQDKNISWLALGLGEIGINLAEVRIIPDVTQTIIETVKSCSEKFDYIFTTGGIGPTHDDITSAAVAEAFDRKLEINPEAAAILEKHYGKENLNKARLKMAEIPASAKLIYNPVSAAPGFIINNVYVMAGVPRVMQAMFDNIKDELRGGEKTLSKTASIFTTEGNIAEGLTAVQKQFPEVEIGSYPFIKNGRLGTSLVCRSSDEQKLEDCFEVLKKFLLLYSEEIEIG